MRQIWREKWQPMEIINKYDPVTLAKYAVEKVLIDQTAGIGQKDTP